MTVDVTRPSVSVEHAPSEVPARPLEADLVAGLRPRLADVLADGDVDRAVRDALTSLGPVRVTTYLPILVERRVRQGLRRTA